MDLTRNLKNQFIDKNEYQKNPFSNLSPQYAWNTFLSTSLQSDLAHKVVFPIINGFVNFTNYEKVDEEKELCFGVISRKDHRRTGLRFWVRGIDIDGNTANSSENEFIIIIRGKENSQLISYMQIRGSIPVFWSQRPSLDLNPWVII